MPVSIGFPGTISEVEDPAGVFAGIPLPTGRIEGSFTIDPDAGIVSFGDGTTGQRPPTGAGTIRGTYRYGAGEAGNAPPGVILFRNCFVGTVFGFHCVPGQGGDAYVVDFPSLAGDGFVQKVPGICTAWAVAIV